MLVNTQTRIFGPSIYCRGRVFLRHNLPAWSTEHPCDSFTCFIHCAHAWAFLRCMMRLGMQGQVERPRHVIRWRRRRRREDEVEEGA